MIDIDIATLRFVSALELLILPTLLWAFLRPAPTMTATKLWIAAGFVMAVGNLLLLQWNVLTFPGKDLMIRLVFFTGLILRIQSFRLDLGIPLSKRTLWLGYAAYVALHEAVRFLSDGPVALLVFTSMMTTLLTANLVWLTLTIARREQSRGAVWLACGLAFYTVLFFARVIALLTGHTPVDQLASSAIADAIGIALVLLPIIVHMGYLGICIERVRRAESVAVRNLSQQAEMDALRQQIAVLDRRRSLGEMAAMLSHELKQPLTAVLTSAQAARLGVLSGQLAHDQIDEFLGRIADGARRANMLIERIGAFVRPSPTVLQSISLNDVVHEAVALSEGLLRSAQVAMEAHYSPASPQVSGDPLQLSQVILNLIRNGIEANGMGAGRELAVTCSIDGGDGVITVRDRGPGFAPDAVDRLGTPFFTTKPDGMGMGLAIAQSIARQHGGSLCFANAVDGGAQVELRLPLKCTVDRQVARS